MDPAHRVSVIHAPHFPLLACRVNRGLIRNLSSSCLSSLKMLPTVFPKSLFSGALFLALTLPATAAAEDDDLTRARALITKGNLALRKGDDVMAREYYRQSFELEETFDSVCNLGGTEVRSRLFTEAYEHLQICLHIYPEDEDLRETRERIAATKDEVRQELSDEQARAIDTRVIEYLKERQLRRDNERLSAQPTSTTHEEVSATAAPSDPRTSARVPLSIGLGVVGLLGSGVGIGFQLKASGHNSNADDLRAGIEADDGYCAGDTLHLRCADLKDAVDRTKSARVVRTISLAAGGAFLAGAVVTYFLWPHAQETDAAAFALSPQIAREDSGAWTLGFQGHF